MGLWFRRSGSNAATEGAGTSVAEEKPQTEAGKDAAREGEASGAEDPALREFLLRNFLYEERGVENSAGDADAAADVPGAPAAAEEPDAIEYLSAEEIAEAGQAAEKPAGAPGAAHLHEQAPLSVEQPQIDEKPSEHSHPALPGGSTEPKADASEPRADALAEDFAPSDWAFEEKLASHKEWIDSKGMTGKRAALTDAKLEGAELIGINLRYADLHAANMQAADLLMADLRDACLTRADLEESCLVGANLEAADLEGASLGTAMGLVNRQLAGANLRDASLPAQILEFPARVEFEAGARATQRYFGALLGLAGLSLLALWRTKDVQLIADRSILPFLHSSAAAAALPTAELFLIVPAIIFILYAVFQFHLQRVWDAALELPAIFPDGRVLGAGAPRIVVGLLRAHFRWMNQDAPSTRFIEKAIAICLGYWLAPLILTLFWARYLTRQDLHGTALLEVLAAAGAGIAFYASARIGRRQERWIFERRLRREIGARIAAVNPISVTIGALAILTLLGVGTIEGIPHDKSRAPEFISGDVRRWMPTVFWSAGFDPYADLTEAAISRAPAHWNGDAATIASVAGARLNGARLRYAQAYGAFLVNAHLWRANFEGAFLAQADLRGADLSQATLDHTVLESADLRGANLNRSDLDEANLERADLRGSNLSYGSLVGARLVDAQMQGASLYGATLPSSHLNRANLEKADLRDAHLETADLSHADLQQAYLWSSKLYGGDLEGARLGGAIFIGADLRAADLNEAQLAGTVLNDANLSGATLDNADLRGALGLTAKQVCSAKSRAGALLDPPLQGQVDAECGAGVASAAGPQ